ncbi:MAG TPA: NAD-dependent succinate-semialdehyde dehydrogenase [Gammaproteobacteria bacterium]|nr:NAD-dependent succinate-semialdehyde dehydrogenase [Gammaproteobacteria bacterium]
MTTMETINPATGKTIKSYPLMQDAEVETILRQAHTAHMQWRKTPFAERAKLMNSAAAVLRKNSDRYAARMTEEMGKPIKQAHAEIEKCAWACEYFAEHAEQFLAQQEVKTDARRSFVTFQPLGVVFAIMPWNYPLWQVFRFIAPNIMAGNAGVLKHSPNVTGCALDIESIMHEAGFPKELFRTVIIDTDQAAKVIANDDVQAVTLTGSVGAGRAVASEAGKALKKTVLELGGSDAYVILEDADVEAAAKSCVQGRLVNSGQSCIAAKRFIVVDAVREQFEKLALAELHAARMGDPTDESNTVGPMARGDLRDQLHAQVEKSVAAGARCLTGGELPDGPGFYYPPTFLTDVKPGMPAYSEELFGPVATLIPVADEAEALKVANGTGFGLGSAVFTRDLDRGIRLATSEIHAGACFVNDFVRSDPRLPFGGIKNSGYGRELSVFGIHEFVNIKAVSVK